MVLFLDAISDPCNMFSSSLTVPHTEATARSTHSLLGLAMVRRYSWHKQPWGTLSGETRSKPLYNPPSDLEHNLGCLVRIHGSKATSIQRTFPGDVANFGSEFVMFVIFVGDSQLIFLRDLTKLRRCRICFQVSLLSHMPQRGNQTLIEHSWTHTTKVTKSRPIELWRTLPHALPLKHTQAQTLYWADWRHIDLVSVTVA